MKRLFEYFFVVLAAWGCFFPVTRAVAQNWQVYPYIPAGSTIQFPRDEGSHPGSKTEWWYLNMHLEEKNSGRRLAAMVTYFNNQIKLLNLTDETTGEFLPNSCLGRLVSGTGFLHLTHTAVGNPTPDRFFTLQTGRRLEPFRYFLDAGTEKIRLHLFLTATKPPLLIAGDGYLPVGSSGTTYYYSLPLLSVFGEWTENGTTDSVSGIGWMDHQWGNFFVTPTSKEAYEWFSVQLEDNRQLVFWDIFTARNRIPHDKAHKMCTLSFADGSQDTSLSFSIQRLSFWKSPRWGLTFSHQWRFRDPKHHIDLFLHPDVDDQVADVLGTMPFYEGSCSVSGIWNGDSVKGVGFAELLHRYQAPKVHFDWPPQGDFPTGKFRISWQIENPDDGRPLFFDLFLINDSTRTAYRLAHHWKDTSFVFDNHRFPVGLRYRIKLVAYSSDSSLTNQTVSPDFALFPVSKGAVAVLAPYPNPFSRNVSVAVYVRRHSASKQEALSFKIFNVLGRLVWEDRVSIFPNELATFHWLGTTSDGTPLAPGIYFLTIRVAGQTVRKKLVKLP